MQMADISVPKNTTVLLAECAEVGPSEVFSMEKLCPVLAFYTAPDFTAAAKLAQKVAHFGGLGHTACLHTHPDNSERVRFMQELMPTGRVLIDSPGTFGAIGDVYNFRLEPALTLGCGSWGGNSFAGNVGLHELLNIKHVAMRRENMMWFKIPRAVYFNRDSHVEALKDLKAQGLQRAFIVTDHSMKTTGLLEMVEAALDEHGLAHFSFTHILPDPDTNMIMAGVAEMKHFQPDVVLALGGGSPIDAAKAMRLLYEHPELRMDDLFCRFMDIRKKIVQFPNLGSKIKSLVAIPTTSGTAAEITPFVVITDSQTGRKYPIADYSLTPDMAIVDSEFVMSMPAQLTAHTGMDAITHALESYVSVCATDYTRGCSLQALRLLFQHLPAAYRDGNALAREKVHNGSTIAGMAFANAFLGITHSLAHTLGSHHHVSHGLANALLLPHVIKFNATQAPFRRAVWSQYTQYHALESYAEVAKELRLCAEDMSDEQASMALLAAIVQLCQKLDIPDSIRDVVPSQEAWEKTLQPMAREAFDDQCTPANPRAPLCSELEELLDSAYHQGMQALVADASTILAQGATSRTKTQC